jgi:glutamate dehydrogenase (NADP+)
MLFTLEKSLKDKVCLVSGAGNVAQFTTRKLIDFGAKVMTLSDSSGYIYDEKGIDREKLEWAMRLKNVKRGRIKEYADKYPEAVYTPVDASLDHNPLWNHKADCAFPCATQNEINQRDAENLVRNGVVLVAEGANMPTTLEGINLFLDSGVLFAPGKAANAGGVSVSGLEMTQNSMRLSWTRQEVDDRLKIIMESIHRTCLETAAQFGMPGNYVMGANIAGFVKVAEAMLDQGVV